MLAVAVIILLPVIRHISPIDVDSAGGWFFHAP